MRIHLIAVAVALIATAVSAGELRPLITPDDYPPEAVRHHWQGDVVVDITINARGRVTQCTVAKSSGHQVLDEATCKIVIDRAHFEPGTDLQGNATETHLILPPITWSLE